MQKKKSFEKTIISTAAREATALTKPPNAASHTSSVSSMQINPLPLRDI
jgi:hypothetical protein